jgi:hypothetical protein
MTDFFSQIFCDFDPIYSVIIDDDGRVAYAYLYEEEKIVGDIWLYNRAMAPTQTIWNEEDVPFLNPSEFIDERIVVEPVTNKSEITCEWKMSPANELLEVLILLRGNAFAKLAPGSKPGWSSIVKKDGPLAKIF